jgi:TM2 domain-containing membrane protein YozV
LRLDADKSIIMDKYMKRGIILSVFFAIALTGLFAQEEWRLDADRADEYYRGGDHDAAWLFYERAMARGSDDGLVLYRTAESFRLQELVENPEFGAALFAVAAHYLQNQYPDDSALIESQSYFDDKTIVNRQFLRQTYAVVGAKAPKTRRPVSEGFGTISGFFANRIEELGQFVLISRSDGIREGLSWARARVWSLLLSLLIVNALTGIILPIVMAVTVAREGRKSYVTAYAFLLHWGVLGIHRFYLGRYISGVIWLLTGGLLGVGIFFDLFLTGAYIRFWNEDNRGDRPIRSVSSKDPNRVKQQKVKQQKVKKTKAPKAAKPVKAAKEPKKSKAPKAEKIRRSSSVSDKDEEFSFSEPAIAAAAVSAAATPEVLEPDDDFGDLPDLSFDDDGADPSVPLGSMEDDFAAELSEELSDDDFDIKSFE